MCLNLMRHKWFKCNQNSLYPCLTYYKALCESLAASSIFDEDLEVQELVNKKLPTETREKKNKQKHNCVYDLF